MGREDLHEFPSSKTPKLALALDSWLRYPPRPVPEQEGVEQA